MRKRLLPTIAAATLLGLSVPAAADSLRCGSRLISEGDHQAKVAELCGKPAQVDERTIYRAGIPRQPGRDTGDFPRSPTERELALHDRSYVEVPTEVWIYNFGPNRLMREVVFENNRVVKVQRLDYGY